MIDWGQNEWRIEDVDIKEDEWYQKWKDWTKLRMKANDSDNLLNMRMNKGKAYSGYAKMGLPSCAYFEFYFEYSGPVLYCILLLYFVF